jgi:hypothetical protein
LNNLSLSLPYSSPSSATMPSLILKDAERDSQGVTFCHIQLTASIRIHWHKVALNLPLRISRVPIPAWKICKGGFQRVVTPGRVGWAQVLITKRPKDTYQRLQVFCVLVWVWFM